MKEVTISTTPHRRRCKYNELLGMSEEGLFQMVNFVFVSAK